MPTMVDLENIYNEGWAAYYNKKQMIENPYDIGTRRHLYWKNGWLDAMRDMAEDMAGE